MFQFCEANAFDVLRRVPDASVQLVVTDPPYESLEKHRARGTTTRLVEWFPTITNAQFETLFREFYRVLADDSHCYVIIDPVTAFAVEPMGRAAGFTFHKPLIWDKVHIGMGYHYRSRYEMVLFFEKGTRRVNDLSQADVIAKKRIIDGYPTQKPVELLSVLVRQSTKPKQLVLDPFMGSGSTGMAAALNGANFLGVDISSEAVAIARQRMLRYGATEQTIFPIGPINATVTSSV